MSASASYEQVARSDDEIDEETIHINNDEINNNDMINNNNTHENQTNRNNNNIRINIISDEEGRNSTSEGNQRVWKIFIVFETIIQLPPAIAAIVFSFLTWQTEQCEQPLWFWAIVYSILLFSVLFVSWSIYLEPSDNAEEWSSRRKFAETVRKPLENFAVGWLLMGQVWVQASSECEKTAPIMLTLCFWLVIIGFCYFLLPCIIVILMLPFLCLCLPCVIRVLARFVGPMQLGGKGASDQVVNAIPKKKYHPGLFEDETDPQCAICLSPYEENQEIRLLPCDPRHHFHQECVDEWLHVNASCPVCRARLVQGENEEDDDHDREDDAQMNPV